MKPAVRPMARTARPQAFVAAFALALTVAVIACEAEPRASPSVTAGQTPPPLTTTAPPASSAAPAETGPGSGSPALTEAEVLRVVDGDTIEVETGGQIYKVRYIGIDTPETVDPRRPVQCVGKEAAERNRQLVEGRTVGLEKDVSEVDQFGRLLRYVWVGDRMVNSVLVEEGYAMASTYPPDVKYAGLFASLQAQAREAGRGLWGSACASPTPAPAGAVCDYSGTSQPVIKGNISSSGEKIYHVPGGAFYDKTVIDEGKGERWFCTEAEAVAAGWRKSLR
mgnify:CR=1 FL=1